MSSNHALTGLLKDHQLNENHIALAAEALANFTLITCEDGQCPNIQEALGRSGMLNLPQPVLMVMFALIAQGLLGRFWDCMRRSAQPEDIVPVFSKEALVNSADLAQKLFAGHTYMDKANAAKDMKKWANLPPLKP
jgi:hypothetical protein